MKISIQNYNVINNLDYELAEHKINFLFGISGCGKSSIAYALTNDTYINHVPYGTKEITPKVLIDGNTIKCEQYKMFDFEYMSDILIHKTQGEDVYNILIGDHGNVESLKSEYKDSIQDLIEKKDYIYGLEGKISTLIKDLKVDYIRDGKTYKSTCLIHKLTSNVEKEEVNYVKSKNLTATQLKWFNDGTKTNSYKNDKCPFCNKKLSKTKKEQISRLLIFDAKTFEKINAKSEIFRELKIKEPDWIRKKEVNNFNKQISDYFKLLPEFQKIINYITLVEKTDISVEEISPLKVSKEMSFYYPEIAECVDNFISKYNLIKKKIYQIKKSTDKLLSNNLRKINDYINLLGIKYQFCKDMIDDTGKKANFVIKAIIDDDSIDRVENLSFGEKNIIGLILFLIANRNYKMLIIDDPASSFDEYRRKVIFDILYKMKNEDTTMLVLSHDHVFAKFAVYHYEKSSNSVTKSNMEKLYFKYTGNVDYLETYENTQIKPITSHSFDTMSNFIKLRVDELGNEINYQLAINLRLYYEINKAKKYHKSVYGYLSAILHRFDKSVIVKNLEKVGRTEYEILEVLKNDFGKDFVSLKDDYIQLTQVDKFNSFEKIIYAREKCKNSEKGKIIKDELSNVVHMNLAYAICLNPYQYNYFSNYVYEYLKEELKIDV